MEFIGQFLICVLAFAFFIGSSEVVANSKGQSLYKNNKDGDDN